jgi:hypothetical protein
MERAIFARVMQIGLAAMKCYFAEKGTGDIGAELQLENGKILKKETRLYGRNYFSVFSKIKVPRTCYRFKGEKGVMPLDAQANLPKRCYSKGMNVREISDKILAIAVKKINHRSRKCLEYQTPHEVYYQALHGAFAT